MKKYNKFILEKKEYNKYNAVLMLYVNIDGWKSKIKDFVKLEDIYDDETKDFGLENNPHVTILYGFDNTIDYKNIKKYLNNLEDIKIDIKNISIFNNDEYDVLKLDVHSDELTTMNKELKEKFDNKNDYDDYHAHITISYLIKDKSKKYLTKDFYKDIKIDIKEYVYSYRDDEDKKIVHKFKIKKEN